MDLPSMWPALQRFSANRTIWQYMLAFACVALLILAGASLTALPRLAHMARLSDDFYQQVYRSTQLSAEARYEVLLGRRLLRDIIMEPDAAMRASLQQALIRSDARVLASLQALGSLDQQAHTVPVLAKSAIVQFEQFMAQRGTVLALAERGRSDEAWALTLLVSPQSPEQQLDDTLGEIRRLGDVRASETWRGMMQNYQQEVRATLLWFVLAAVLLLGCAWWVTRAIRRPLDALTQAMAAIADARLDTPIPALSLQNESGVLARHLARLRDVYRVMELQRWVKVETAHIASEMQQSASLSELAQRMLARLAPLLGLGGALLYLHRENRQALTLVGTYGRAADGAVKNRLAYGEGLVGQCALDHEPLTLSLPSEGRIVWAAGAMHPAQVRILPVCLNQRLLAVLELSLLSALNVRQQVLLDALLPLLALNLEILERVQKSRYLLEATQQQAKRLEQQTAALQAQQVQLGQTEAWYRSLIEAAPDGMLVLDEEQKVTLANPRAHALFACTDGSLIGTKLASLLGDEYGVLYARLSSEAGSAVLGRDLPARRMDGSRFSAELGLSRLPQLGGQKGVVCVAVRDVSAEHQARIRLDDQLAFQSALLDTIPYPLFYKGEDSRFLGFNRAYEQAFGVLRADLVGKRVLELDFLPEADRLRYQREDEEMISTLGQLQTEVAMPYADGQLHDTLYWVSGFARSDGKPGGLVGTFVDISERKQMEACLRQANERLALAQEAGRVGVFDLDLASGHNYWTPQLERMFGLAPGTFSGTLAAWQALLHPADRDEAMRHFVSALEGRESNFEDDWRILLPSGEAHWLHVNARIIRDGAGLPLRAIGVNVDVNDLVSAREAARDSARAKADFLANMSHEIRTPMNAIIGMTHLALGTELSARQRDYLDKIALSSRHLLAIINDILDFSRVESGKLVLESVPFTLASVLDNVLNLLGERAQSKHLDLRLDVAPDVPAVLLGDPLRLGQILINYTGNAIKFTPSGEVVIHVHLDDEQGDKVALLLSVSDTGIGLSEDARARLFQPFEQADVSTTRQYGGTGLGLAISHRLAALMDGEVGVDSREGVGSTFWARVWLGRAVSGMPDAMPQEGDTAKTLAGARILLAEDNVLNQQVAAELLARVGAVVEVVEDGAQALARVQQAPFDLVLMDMQMPVMDGMAATRAIRALPGMAQLPILAMTASAMATDKAQCLAAGMNDHIAKPIEPASLYATLSHWLAPRPAQLPLAAYEGFSPQDGLRRCGGNSALYLDLLRRFVDAEAGAAGEIAQALQQGDASRARLHAHSLRGVAGNLGAVALQEAATQLESAIENGAGESALPAFTDSLAALCTHLAGALPDVASTLPAAAAAPLDEATLASLLDLIEGSDASARGEFTALAPQLRQSLGSGVDQVAAALASFDFDEAGRCLRHLVSAYGGKHASKG
ncbi:PAS domain S-box protein [Rhodobacteraceae bacterium CH30]|nr:PAS domain S-box protein [Rhodobacteraceae bacterium CH30]